MTTTFKEGPASFVDVAKELPLPVVNTLVRLAPLVLVYPIDRDDPDEMQHPQNPGLFVRRAAPRRGTVIPPFGPDFAPLDDELVETSWYVYRRFDDADRARAGQDGFVVETLYTATDFAQLISSSTLIGPVAVPWPGAGAGHGASYAERIAAADSMQAAMRLLTRFGRGSQDDQGGGA